MAIHVQIDPLERTATLRGVHSLCAGESSEVIVSGVPDADTATMSLRVYRDASEASQVACSVRPGTDPAEEGLVPVEGRAALRRGVLDLRASAVSEWVSEDAAAAAVAEEARKSGSKEPETRAAASYRRPDSAWLVVADSARVWAACAVPFVLRPFDGGLSPDPEVPLPSYAERAEAAAEAAGSAASAASASAASASASADRAAAATDGKADLVDGKVPASQLPSYVDDVLEYDSASAFPETGESGKIYVDKAVNAVYRWSGSAYVEVSPSRDWSGELAAKRDRTDFSVGNGWLLVKPDGTQVWLAYASQGQWAGGGFELQQDKGGTWSMWSDSLEVGTAAPEDAVSLEFSSGSSVYRLVRGSRLALDTEIPAVPTPVAPSTDPSARGKPADAKATGDALAGKLSTSGGTMTGTLNVGGTPDATVITPAGGVTTPRLDARAANISGVDIEAIGAGSVLEFKQLNATTGAVLVPLPESNAQPKTVAFVGDVADATDLRYRIAEAEYATTGAKLPDGVIIGDSADNPLTYTLYFDTSSENWFLGNEEIGFPCSWDADGTNGENAAVNISDFYYNGALMTGVPDLIVPRALADRTVNLIAADDETSIDIELPDVQEEGYSRDFYIAVTCGSTAPTLNSPSGVTLVNAKGEEPDLTLTQDATTVLRFTEVKEADAEADPSEPSVFCVTGGANGGGGSLDLSVLVEEFSEESTYDVGYIVQYQGDLYECQYPIETPGPWSPGNWVGASPVIPVLLGMIRGNSSALETKAESTALAPAWISGHAYFKGDHASYKGLLYECLSTVAGSTDPSADTTHWKLTDLAAPDATLDILSDGRLRVVAADGTPMWTQGYGLSSESAVALSCDRINKYVFAETTATAFSDSSTYAVGDRVTYGGKVYKCSTAVETAGAWTAANWDEDPDTQAFALPGVPFGVVGDFVLDVDNTANEVQVMVAISGTLGTDYDLIVEKGRSSVDVLTIEGGALAELYFTMTAFGTAAKPAWRVVRLNVEMQEVGS